MEGNSRVGLRNFGRRYSDKEMAMKEESGGSELLLEVYYSGSCVANVKCVKKKIQNVLFGNSYGSTATGDTY